MAPAMVIARPPVDPGPRAPMKSVAVSLADRFSSWRASTSSLAAAVPRAIEPVAPPPAPPSIHWRDELAIWTRSVIAGTTTRLPPNVLAIELLAQRLAIAAPLHAGLAFLYGAHLCGEPGVAPVDLARVLAQNWDEALGRGQLASSEVARFRDSRIRLATFAQRMLDQLHPATGTIVGTPGPIELLSACVVVAPEDQPLGLVAEVMLPLVGGAILAADSNVDPRELVLEARAHGAVAMVRAAATIASDTTIILVVSDEARADQLELPRLS